MKRQTTSLLALWGILLLFSALIYSCVSNQEPIYTGKWVAMDSSQFYTPDSLVRKTTINLSESKFVITKSTIVDTAKSFIDSLEIKGRLSVLAEKICFLVNEFSVRPDTAKGYVPFKSVDNDYKRVSEEYKIDTMPTYTFRVVNSSTLLLKIGDTEKKYHRE
ncbi:hypothetical protein [uncultured Acetobacteroides sp.]|uniref:hypothetical protein n=1 Tax=uncultured Acetobacteroides sp. TaxID=1760811 RepID=UPI0029F50237|nr:hypothetical protein [uncultured Acetobacteroides sp.]